jgi:hypothetical protein
MRKLLAPLVIAVLLIALGSLGPLVDSVRAATKPPPVALAPRIAAAPAQADTTAPPVPAAQAGGFNPAAVGNEVDDMAASQYGHLGAFDQTKPLDFRDQPASVPRVYDKHKLYNLQVLRGASMDDVVTAMGNYSDALGGVECTYCHAQKNYAYDTPQKQLARQMQLMTKALAKDWIEPVKRDYPSYVVNGVPGCQTCHRGSTTIPVNWNIVPIQFVVFPHKTTKQVGYVIDSMYAAAKSLGVNCTFCHNTADFITLQYIPTNKIARRMWMMVDTINHEYLPPSVKAVTCYTCHRGNQYPNELVTSGTDETPVDKVVPLHPEIQNNPGGFAAAGVLR